MGKKHRNPQGMEKLYNIKLQIYRMEEVFKEKEFLTASQLLRFWNELQKLESHLYHTYNALSGVPQNWGLPLHNLGHDLMEYLKSLQQKVAFRYMRSLDDTLPAIVTDFKYD